jgi:sulfur-carrier protein adenylyltransferase/sulfurtransferase
VTTSPDWPPLVAPGPPLSSAAAARYARHAVLPGVGVEGQRRLAAAKVLVVGAGGLGSPVLLYLTAAGVGHLSVVDDDVVDASNLQRQVLHATAAVGRPKVDSAAERLTDLNPDVQVVRHRVRLDAATALDLVRGHDLVIDGTDNFATRYLVADACEIADIPVVWGSIFRFDGQVSVFWPGRGPLYRDLFPVAPPPGSVPSCAEGGVFGALCGAIGSVMATEAIKLICGVGRPLVGRVLVHDALAQSWRTLTVRPDPTRAPVTEMTEGGDLSCALPAGSAVGSVVGSVAVSAAGSGSAGDGANGAEPDVEIDPGELARRLAEAGPDLVLLDVREPAEHAMAAIPGSVLLPLGRLVDDAGTLTTVAAAVLPPHATIVVHCQSGARSARALTLLAAAGRPGAVHLAGGMAAWQREGRPTVSS